MKNTGCSTRSDPAPALRRLRVLGAEVVAKGYTCARNGGPHQPVEGRVKLQLSILPTNYCPCACPFCIATDTGNPARIDLRRLEGTLVALAGENVVRGISITGGEPFVDVPLLDRLIRMVFGIFGTGMEISLNTNGMGLERLGDIRDLSHVDAVHISRHHWDDGVNRALFGGGPVPDAGVLRRAIASISYPELFVLNCMLLKDGVCTAEDAHRYMDFAIDLGAKKVSFITGAPVNDYVRRQTLDYEAVLRADDPALLMTQRFRDFGWCRCQDGVYCSEDGRLIQFYGRKSDSTGCGYARGLIIGPDGALRAGFGGPPLGPS